MLNKLIWKKIWLLMEICPQRHQNYLETAAVQKTLNVDIVHSPQYDNEAEN